MRERTRMRASHECHGELKSLVASPLHWLPRDQQGAKSTQGRKKWKVLERGKGDIQYDGETKKGRRRGKWRGREIWTYI